MADENLLPTELSKGELNRARIETLLRRFNLNKDNESQISDEGHQRRLGISYGYDSVRAFGWEAKLKVTSTSFTPQQQESLRDLQLGFYKGIRAIEIVPTESQTIPLNILGAYTFINVNFPNKFATLTLQNLLEFPLFELFSNLGFLPITQDINTTLNTPVKPPVKKFDLQLELKTPDNQFHSLIYLAGCEVRSVSLDPFDYSITNKMHEFKLGVVFEKLISTSDPELVDQFGFGGQLDSNAPQLLNEEQNASPQSAPNLPRPVNR